MVLTLQDGRAIWLDSLHQYTTYAGLMVGNPTELHDDFIQEGLAYAKWIFRYQEIPPLLVPPPRIRFDLPPSRQPQKPGEPESVHERLPYVTCTAKFHSKRISAEADGSSLLVVWFQDEFALPIDPGVQAHLMALDWAGQAQDWWF